MWIIEKYVRRFDKWDTVSRVEDADKAIGNYESMRASEHARAGLRLINPDGHIVRLCHA